MVYSSQNRESYIYSTLDNPNLNEVPSEKQHVSESQNDFVNPHFNHARRRSVQEFVDD